MNISDCVWFDCDSSVIDQVVEDAEKIMTSIPEHYKEIYGIDVPVAFKVDSEVGPNMKDLH